METKPAAAPVKMVRIFHTGKGYGPMDTKFGLLNVGASLEVSEELAKKLTGTYKHVKLAADVIPGITVDPKTAEENAKLKAEIKKLEGALAAEKDSAELLRLEKADLQKQIEDLKAQGEKGGKGKK